VLVGLKIIIIIIVFNPWDLYYLGYKIIIIIIIIIIIAMTMFMVLSS